jgi:site-specific recombinase XerD
MPAIRRYLAERGAEAGPFLIARGAGRLTDQGLMLALRRRAIDAGVKAFSPHDLRRSFITGRLRAGKDLSVVQRLAGHSNIATTTRYDLRGEVEQAAAVVDPVIPFVDG